MCMTLEMTYFRAGLVQLIVSRSDSELEEVPKVNCATLTITTHYCNVCEQVGQLTADGPRDVHVIITLYRH